MVFKCKWDKTGNMSRLENSGWFAYFIEKIRWGILKFWTFIKLAREKAFGSTSTSAKSSESVLFSIWSSSVMSWAFSPSPLAKEIAYKQAKTICRMKYTLTWFVNNWLLIIKQNLPRTSWSKTDAGLGSGLLNSWFFFFILYSDLSYLEFVWNVLLL